jgi:hypothetical protein
VGGAFPRAGRRVAGFQPGRQPYLLNFFDELRRRVPASNK